MTLRYLRPDHGDGASVTADVAARERVRALIRAANSIEDAAQRYEDNDMPGTARFERETLRMLVAAFPVEFRDTYWATS